MLWQRKRTSRTTKAKQTADIFWLCIFELFQTVNTTHFSRSNFLYWTFAAPNVRLACMWKSVANWVQWSHSIAHIKTYFLQPFPITNTRRHSVFRGIWLPIDDAINDMCINMIMDSHVMLELDSRTLLRSPKWSSQQTMRQQFHWIYFSLNFIKKMGKKLPRIQPLFETQFTVQLYAKIHLISIIGAHISWKLFL